VFFIACIAETNRAPFDLAEAESELVSGFMTEHAAVIFVFFFLAEYASIVLICILTSILFLGGYILDITPLIYLYSITQNFFEFFILLMMYLIIQLLSIVQSIMDNFITIDLLKFAYSTKKGYFMKSTIYSKQFSGYKIY